MVNFPEKMVSGKEKDMLLSLLVTQRTRSLFLELNMDWIKNIKQLEEYTMSVLGRLNGQVWGWVDRTQKYKSQSKM